MPLELAVTVSALVPLDQEVVPSVALTRAPLPLVSEEEAEHSVVETVLLVPEIVLLVPVAHPLVLVTARSVLATRHLVPETLPLVLETLPLALEILLSVPALLH